MKTFSQRISLLNLDLHRPALIVMCPRLDLNKLRSGIVRDHVDDILFALDLMLDIGEFFVRCQQMLLQERFITECSITVHTLRVFQMNLVVSAERRLVPE